MRGLLPQPLEQHRSPFVAPLGPIDYRFTRDNGSSGGFGEKTLRVAGTDCDTAIVGRGILHTSLECGCTRRLVWSLVEDRELEGGVCERLPLIRSDVPVVLVSRVRLHSNQDALPRGFRIRSEEKL